MERRRRVRQKDQTTKHKDALLPFDLSSSSHRDANLRTDNQDQTEVHHDTTSRPSDNTFLFCASSPPLSLCLLLASSALVSGERDEDARSESKERKPFISSSYLRLLAWQPSRCEVDQMSSNRSCPFLRACTAKGVSQ